MDEVVLQYQITWEEFRRAQVRAVPTTGGRVIAVIVIGAILIGALTKDTWWIYYGVIFAVTFAAMLFYFGPRRYWKSGIGYQELKTVTISNQGIVSKSDSLEMKLEWSRFGSVRESKEFFILMPEKKKMGAFMIVKRGFVSESDENTARQLLATHISQS